LSADVWSVEQVRALGVRTDLVTAARVLGIGRTTAHDLARRGEFPVPVLRCGSRYVVPVAPLLDVLGIDRSLEAGPDVRA
jgi:predicted site-specific integrase-resolvase